MPMRSQAQRSYLWLHHPKVAREFETETKKGKDLPDRIHPKKERKRYRGMDEKEEGKE